MFGAHVDMKRKKNVHDLVKYVNSLIRGFQHQILRGINKSQFSENPSATKSFKCIYLTFLAARCVIYLILRIS